MEDQEELSILIGVKKSFLWETLMVFLQCQKTGIATYFLRTKIFPSHIPALQHDAMSTWASSEKMTQVWMGSSLNYVKLIYKLSNPLSPSCQDDKPFKLVTPS